MATTIALPVLLFLACLLVGALVGVVLLLLNPKTRTATSTVLGICGMIVVLAFGGLFAIRFARTTKQPAEAVGVNPSAKAQPVASDESSKTFEALKQLWTASTTVKDQNKPALPAASKSASSETAPKGDDALSQAAATKTVGILRAMVRALGLALAEEEQALAAKKGAAASAAAPSAPAKPAWVDASPSRQGEVYQTTVVVGPFTTRAECDAKTPEEVQKALDHYVEIAIGPEAVGMVQLPDDYLRESVIVDQWEETRSYSVGPMVQLHLRLQFNAHVKGRVEVAYREAVVAARLRVFGGWSVIGLSFLAVGFSYLKTDIATRGVYRGRLRLAAATVILVLAAVAAALVA